MRRALLTCLLLGLLPTSVGAAEPTWAITAAAPGALGGGAALGDFLAAQGRTYRDLSAALRDGELPLGDVKVLVVGSFVTSDAKVRATLLAQRTALAKWLAAGGVLVQFGQQDAAEPQVACRSVLGCPVGVAGGGSPR